MLVLSDWWIIITPEQGITKYLRSILIRLLQFSTCTKDNSHCRWSQYMSKYNLLERCFKDPPSILKYIFIKGIKDALIGFLYVAKKQVDEQLLVKFVIEELQKKAKLAPDLKETKEVNSARGNLALENEFFLVSEYLNPWTVDVDYDESVLIWHLATDICYWTSQEHGSTDNVDGMDYRSFSKWLSDYMSYLLLRQQSLVSLVVGMSENRFEDTCAEARKFMNKSLNVHWFSYICAETKKCLCSKLNCQTSGVECENHGTKEEEEFFKEFCIKVLKVKAHIPPIVAKGDKSKSVLFDACRLAEQLKMFGSSQWEITSKVWVELLCYAANRASPRSHVAQLRRGGELITLVWLLMAHLGLGERFLQNQGFGWTKLIIHK
ncbi:uncharacterized protein LOC125495098 [Beta vulgaris subsp. vulgaris]|uniref:uncharacterized protein LOC125495098 n=1 Tax=Beta vulgaris subsp. vulgaris TaxID=3555 RepID=UPI0020374E28|nr:uncharacterized protein LOC125495098 [Beta vulgaris subsp. vulgaris]